MGLRNIYKSWKHVIGTVRRSEQRTEDIKQYLKEGRIVKGIEEEKKVSEEILEAENELFEILNYEEEEFEEVLDAIEEYQEFRMSIIQNAPAIHRLLGQIHGCFMDAKNNQNTEYLREALDFVSELRKILSGIKEKAERFENDFDSEKREAIMALGSLDREESILKELEQVEQFVVEEEKETEKRAADGGQKSAFPEIEDLENKTENIHSKLVDLENLVEQLEELDKKRENVASKLSKKQLKKVEALNEDTNAKVKECIDVLKIAHKNGAISEDLRNSIGGMLLFLKRIVNNFEEAESIRDNRPYWQPRKKQGRRKFLAHMAAGAAAKGALIDIGTGWAFHEWQYPDGEPSEYGYPAFARDVASGNGRIEIIHLKTRQDPPDYSGDGITAEIENAIGTLPNAKVEAKWLEMEPNLDFYCKINNTSPENLSKKQKDTVKEASKAIKTTVRNTTLYGEEHYGGDHKTKAADILERQLSVFLGDQPFQEGILRVIIAPFNVRAKQDDGVPGEISPETILIHYPKSAFKNQRTQSRLITQIIHLIGHKLYLPHSSTPDVMSISSMDKAVRSHFDYYFSPESKKRWQKIVEKHG